MPFERPTLTQLRDGALQDVAAAAIYDGTTQSVVNPLLLQFDPLTIMAKVQAGLAYEEYGYLDYISLQATPYTATDEFALGWGALIGVTLKPATAAAGTALVSGAAGLDIPVGTSFARGDGVTYSSTADVIIPAGGSAVVPFTADLAAASGTVSAGVALTITQPIAGVTSACVVQSSTAPGADIEADDAFRARYLAKFAAPPNGGSASDYVEWATAVPGITRAWVAANVNGAGTVGVFFMLDDAEAAGGGFPVGTNGVSPLDNDGSSRDVLNVAAGDQLTLANALLPLQPVTALVYALAPTPQPVGFTIANLGAANTLANQAAVVAALQALFLSIGDPRGATIYPSAWETAIATALGAAQYTLVAPVAPVVVAFGSLPTVGPANVAFSA